MGSIILSNLYINSIHYLEMDMLAVYSCLKKGVTTFCKIYSMLLLPCFVVVTYTFLSKVFTMLPCFAKPAFQFGIPTTHHALLTSGSHSFVPTASCVHGNTPVPHPPVPHSSLPVIIAMPSVHTLTQLVKTSSIQTYVF